MSTLNEIIYNALRDNDPFTDGNVARADAVEDALLAASGGADHLIRVNGFGWTLQHPLSERFGDDDLFVCKYSQAGVVIADNILSAEGEGDYRLWEDRTAFQWERVAA